VCDDGGAYQQKIQNSIHLVEIKHKHTNTNMSLVGRDIAFDITDAGLRLLPKAAVVDDDGDDIQLLGQIWLNDYVTLGESIAAAAAAGATKKTVPFPHALRNKFIQMWMTDDHEFELVLSDDPLPGSIVPSFLCAVDSNLDSRFIKMFPCLPIAPNGDNLGWTPNFNQKAQRVTDSRKVDADQVTVKKSTNLSALVGVVRDQKFGLLRNHTVAYMYDRDVEFEQGETVVAVISLIRASELLGWDIDVMCTPGLELCLNATGRDVFVRSVQM
jgi:hypothetical protein